MDTIPADAPSANAQTTAPATVSTPTTADTKAPSFDFHDVAMGLTDAEKVRASEDAAFAQTMLDRHARFTDAFTSGTPTTDADFARWTRATGRAAAGGPGQPVAPAFDFSEVVKGLTPAEKARATNDAGFAQTLVDRHADYSRRSAAGENPLDPDTPGDRGLWEWQNRVAGKPGLLKTAGEAALTLANDVGNALGEVGSIVGDAASGDLTKAAQRTTDLATVATSKALAFNSAIVRGAGQLAEKTAATGAPMAPAFFGGVMLGNPKLAKIMQEAAADTEGRAQLEETYSAHAYENARANYRDEKTAEEMHKRIATVVPALAGILGNTEVNQSAASALSQIPQMGAEAIIAKGAAVAGYGVASAQLRSGVEALAAKRAELSVARTSLDAAVKSGQADAIRDAVVWTKTAAEDIAIRESKMAELSLKAQSEVSAMTEAATSRVAAGKVAQGAGASVSKAGNLAEALEQLPADLAAKIAPESKVLRKVVETGTRMGATSALGAGVGAAFDSEGTGAIVGAIVGGKGFGGVGARVVVNTGRDMQRLGELFAKGESTLPFWRAVRKARDISGPTKQIGAFMDNSVFSAGSRLVGGAAKGGASAAAFGAGLGVLTSPDDPVTGAAAGAGGAAIFGSTVGALGQWRTYDNPAQLARERAGQLRIYKDLLAARPDELKHFEKLTPFTQEQFSNYFAAHPDLKVRYVDDPNAAPGNYDRALPDYITVNIRSKDPLADIVGHEISHYVENHELGGAIVRQAIGDAEAGIPGDYTLRDADGVPVKTADGKAFETNAEFNARRDAYVQRIRATADRAGWSPGQTEAAVARVSSPDYIAREIFAEQHLAYLNSPEYARDLKGIPAASDWVRNSAFLKNALAKFGVVFKGDGEMVRSGILGDFSKSATFDGLMREYYRTRARAKAGDTEFTGGNVIHDEKLLTKETGYVERYYDASGEILRDTAGKPIYDANGRAQVRAASAADKDARGAAEAAVKQLDQAAGISPDAKPTDPDLKIDGNPASPEVVQRRTNADRRTVYAGRFLSPETLAAIEASGKLNAVQLDNLRQLNAELQAGFGAEWTHFYQAATKKGGGPRARSLAGRWRTDLVYGIQITNPGNILIQSVSLEVLGENAARAVSKGDAKLWNNSIGDLMGDVRRYLVNATSGLPGDVGIGAEKKNFINNLLGLRVKAHGDVNPLFDITNQPKTIITSLRLDRINRLTPVAERNVPFSTETYQRVVRNLRPDAEGAVNTPPGSPDAGKPGEVVSETEPHVMPGDQDTSDTLARAYEQLRPDGNADWAGKPILKDRGPLVNEDGQLAFPQTRFRQPIKLTHYTRTDGIEVVDPKFMGTGGGKVGLGYFSMMKGENKSFYFVGNSKPKAEENVSTAFQFKHTVPSFDASRLYDMVEDPADIWDYRNKAKSEAALKAAGYDGFFKETEEGRQWVALFYPLNLKTGKFVSRNPGDNAGNFGYDPSAGLPTESAASVAAKKDRGSVNTRYGSLGDRVSGNPDDVKPAPAMIFVSPNTGELDYATAKLRLNSKEHAAFVEAVRAEVGADASVESAVGDWADGAEDTVAVSFKAQKGLGETRLVAARLGLAANQKAVLHVVAETDGPDSLHKITFPPGIGMDRARRAMLKSGLEFRTLASRGDRVVGYLFDEGRKLTSQLLDLHGHATHPEIKSTPARGEFLGSWTSREEGAEKFKEVLAGGKSRGK